MPKFRDNNEKILFNQQTIKSQTKILNGKIDNENVLEDNIFTIIIQKCQKAYFNDPLVKTTVDLLLIPILQANYEIIIKPGEYQLKSKKLIEYTINNLYDSFSNLKNHSILAIILGCQFFEIVWNIEKFEDIYFNRIIRLLPIKIENIKTFLFNDNGDLNGLEIIDNNNNVKTLYKDNIFYIIHNQFFNDPRGNSEIRHIIPIVEIKENLIKNAEKTIARGVGIPVAFGDTSLMSEDAFEKYKILMRNIANTNGAYAIVDKNEIEKIEFLRVDHSNIMPLLEFLNRDIFFNTLTQFITTGLGQNGSRATAEELKSPYALKVASIVKELESYFQWLINIIISNSSLSLYLKKEDYPQFKFVNVTELDLNVFSSVLSNFVNLGLKLNENDFNYIRQILKLPVLENKETSLTYNFKQNKINDFKIFEMEKLAEIYNDTENKIEEFYDKLIKEITAYIYLKIPIDIDKIYKKMSDFLKEYAINIKQEANKTAIKELRKLNDKREYLLSNKLSQEDSILQFIIKIINIAKELDFEGIEDFEYIENKIKEKSKREKRDLIINIQKEIQDGRGEVFEQTEGIKFKYTSMLDNNVCDVCSSLHDIIFTKEEIIDAGLNFKSPVNPNCLGLVKKNNCRCQLIPIK